MSLNSNVNEESNFLNYDDTAEGLLKNNLFVNQIVGVPKRLSKFASLNSFMTEFGASNVELIVENGVNIPDNFTFPANIIVNAQADTLFNVAATKTLRIDKIAPVGNRRIFTGDGKKVFGKNAVDRISILNWLGNDTSLNATNAINDMLDSASLNNGGKLHFGLGKWQTFGGHIYNNAPFTIEGDGYSPDQFTLGTWIELINDTRFGFDNSVAKFIFKIGGLLRNLELKKLSFNNAYSANATAVIASGAAPQTTIGIYLEQLSFYAFDIGFDLFSESGSWQVEQFSTDKVYFIPKNGGIGFRCNSNNTSLQFLLTYFQLEPNSKGAQLNQAGATNFQTCNFTRVANTSLPPVSGQTNPALPTGVEVNGDHLGISFKNCQDENIGRILHNKVSLYQTYTFDDCLIQSVIDMQNSGAVVVRGGKALAKCIRDNASVSSISYASVEDVTIRADDVVTGVVYTGDNITLNGFTNGGIMTVEREVGIQIRNEAELTKERSPKTYDQFGYFLNDAVRQIGTTLHTRPILELALLNDDGSVKLDGSGNPIKHGFKINSENLLTLNDGLIGGTPNALEFNGLLSFVSGNNGHHVNCGMFWNNGTEYQKFYFEAWVKPFEKCWYVISDGYGGNHNILFGFDGTGTDGFIGLSGNMNRVAGGGLSFQSAAGDRVGTNEWHHIALHYNKVHLIVLIDGVPSAIYAETSNRKSTAVGDGVLFIGGSDHNNFNGRIAKVRLFENNALVSDLSGDTAIRIERNFSSGNNVKPSFEMDFTNYSSGTIPDLSNGFEGAKHNGFFEQGQSIGNPLNNLGSQTGTNPKWVSDAVAKPTTKLVVPATPAGALIFDSFNRNDVTFAWSYALGLGSTHGGSLGAKVWQGSGNYGILMGRVFNSQYATDIATVDASTQNVRVQMKGAGIVFARYTDDNNFIAAVKSLFYEADEIKLVKRVAGVSTVLAAAAGKGAFNTSTIALNVNGANCEILVNGVSKLTFVDPNPSNLTGTRVGFAAEQLNLNRMDDFAVFAAS